MFGSWSWSSALLLGRHSGGGIGIGRKLDGRRKIRYCGVGAGRCGTETLQGLVKWTWGQFLLVYAVWYVVVQMLIRVHKKQSGNSVRGGAQSKMWMRMKWLKAANVDINLCFRRRLAEAHFALH
jgi:hypothetical protein